VSHDYSSETGLLHIYIEGVSLQNNEASSRESAEYGDAAAESASGKASGRVPSASMIASAVKSGFMRVFGSASSASGKF
jgi:hypothetical protein